MHICRPARPGAAGVRRCDRPGTFGAMGLNSPRTSGGASGFMSKVSRWLAAPVRKTMMTDFGSRALERLESVEAAAAAATT